MKSFFLFNFDVHAKDVTGSLSASSVVLLVEGKVAGCMADNACSTATMRV